MFNTPIKRTRLKSLEEVIKFSHRTGGRFDDMPFVKCSNNGQIAFSDERGFVYVTPYRSEIHSILDEAGYRERCFFVPFSNGEERPEEYRWLAKIAEEENWAETYEEAAKIATEKGVKPVVLPMLQKLQIKEIYSPYEDPETRTVYRKLVDMFFRGTTTQDNIGTYIIVDEKTLVICDEYGRTFLVRAKTIINDIVNTLIDAGYTRTAHPEWYIYSMPKEPDTEPKE